MIGTGPFFSSGMRELMRDFMSVARDPRRRSMRQFAEQEIRIPSGPYKGMRFTCSRQPFAGLWLDEVDSGQWVYHNTTGTVQSGKTLTASIIPLCYHVFEIVETVIFALPDMDMADDKWREDILPVIEATRYSRYLPTSGEGSRGGKVKNAVAFTNGATLKFMSGGASGVASDKGRAGFTSRVLIVTEKSAFATSGAASKESSKLEQLRARTFAFGSQARIYEESTVTTEDDPIWTDLKKGTDSKIVCPCPHCSTFVAPEREHLKGWDEATNVKEARILAHFVCPACGGRIDESQRLDMNRAAKLLHRGQTIDEAGNIVGDIPMTETLGFRWSAFHNTLRTAGDVGVDEHNGRHATSEEDAEKKLCQFVWCLPYQDQTEVIAPLNREGIMHRLAKSKKGYVPADAELVSIGIDVGQRKLWWVAVAWLGNGNSVVIDYGAKEVLSEQLGVEPGVLLALRELRDDFEAGWAWMEHEHVRQPDCILVDAGWKDTVICQFIRETMEREETSGRYFAAKGFGDNQFAGQSYHKPRKTGAQVAAVGDNYHAAAFPAHNVHIIEFNADHWKIFVQTRLGTDVKEPGAMLLFNTAPREHLRFAKHITSERQYQEFVPNRGTVMRWKKQGENHLLDATGMASIAGHFLGVRMPGMDAADVDVEDSGEPIPTVTMPDGRPFSVLER